FSPSYSWPYPPMKKNIPGSREIRVNEEYFSLRNPQLSTCYLPMAGDNEEGPRPSTGLLGAEAKKPIEMLTNLRTGLYY
ncbi:MAG TPA: hypothetical protein PK747_06185, partial [Acidobacteriota bacterium]|nr:hypothetical protein [Acidobacteriota bacterium]HQO19937.1 hypothetical protein [Acidobacteriota bacterium]HQQ46984.1 hypothetical protein [Acidobacteriota bacterium]